MKKLNICQGQQRRSPLFWVLAFILMTLMSENVLAQNKCPRPSEKFEVSVLWPTLPEGVAAYYVGLAGRLLVMGKPLFVITDIDDLSMITIPPIVKPFEINLDSPAGPAAISNISTPGQAQAFGWISVPYVSYLTDNNGNGCRSLVLVSRRVGEGGGPSFLVTFNPVTGAPTVVQSFTDLLPILSSSTAELIMSRINGDGRDDFIAKDNGITLAVLTAQTSGNYVVDSTMSALAVWDEFSKAIKLRDMSSADKYYASQGSARLTSLSATRINELVATATGIEAVEAVAKSPELVVLKIISKKGAEFFYYEVLLSSSNGVWKVNAF